jgi:hypothetical protein
LAHLIGFLNRRCHHVNPKWSNIYPANLIRLAYLRYKHLLANTICVVNVHILHTQWETGLVLLAKILQKVYRAMPDARIGSTSSL